MKPSPSATPIAAGLLLAWLAWGTAAAGEHRLPASAKPPLDPVICGENRDLVIRNRSIWSEGDAILATGNCTLEVIDSHIVAGDTGIRVDGNADVRIVGSFVQGWRAAVAADGNSDVSYRRSTLRGGVRVQGNADATDLGANHFEAIPGAADNALTGAGALYCEDGDRVTIVHRYVETEADGVTVEGDCELLLSDSFIRARGSAVRILGPGSVRVRNSTLQGDGYSLLIDGAGEMRAAGTNLVGDIAAGTGRFLDDGGNSRAGLNASAARSASPGVSAGAPASGSARSSRIRIGPGGVEVSSDDGSVVRVGGGGVEVTDDEGERVEVSTGGVEIRGDGKPPEPIETCSELCEIWPGVVSSKRDCVSTVLTVLDYPVLDTPACILVETEAQCRVCAAEIRVRDRDCRTAFDRCIAR